MQGVFAPASPRGGGESAPLAAPLGAPLVNWGEVTAVPDTEFAGVHEVVGNTVVYSPLPSFKLDKYTFFIVPQMSREKLTPEIRPSGSVKWLVPYLAKENNENRWGVPFSYIHEKQMKSKKTNDHKQLAADINASKKEFDNAVQLQKHAEDIAEKAWTALQTAAVGVAADFEMPADARDEILNTLRPLNLLNRVVLQQLASDICRDIFIATAGLVFPDAASRTIFEKIITEYLVKTGQVLEKQKELQAAKDKKNKLESDLKTLQKYSVRYIWENAGNSAILEPYTASQATIDHIIDTFCEEMTDKEFDMNSVLGVASQHLDQKAASAVFVALSGIHAVSILLKRARNAVDVDILKEFQTGATEAARGFFDAPSNVNLRNVLKPGVIFPLLRASTHNAINICTTAIWATLSFILGKERALVIAGPIAVKSKLEVMLGDISKYDRWYSPDVAIPFRDYLPENTEFVYEINEEWLRSRVESAEVFDYDFAVRMQGLTNSTLAAMWASPASNPALDNGHVIMQRFAETLINHFYDMFVVQDNKDYSPESVIREVVHMHKAFADEWVRQNKNTLSPQLEAMGEAYVSLFSTGPLSELRDHDAALIARLLRRHEKYRGHFGLCLQHYMAKMEGDRIGRSPTYKQTNILANQNMLVVKSMAGFLQSNLEQIQRDLQTEAMPTIPSDITKLFNKYTVDWFRIADQLPPPRSRFPGYKHPEGADQDPNRQSKWQKVLDHSSRGGKVG